MKGGKKNEEKKHTHTTSQTYNPITPFAYLPVSNELMLGVGLC